MLLARLYDRVYHGVVYNAPSDTPRATSLTAQAPGDERRCRQCNRDKAAAEFVNAKGCTVTRCAYCRHKYRNWQNLTLTEKLARTEKRVDATPTGRIIWTPRSGNVKLGAIPASISERGTCPPSCGLYDAGCYAEYGPMGQHWRAVTDRGLPWKEFLSKVRGLPQNQLWRHNVAGDLAGHGNEVDYARLKELVDANVGRRGFTFTHKRLKPRVIERAASLGFVINQSFDTLKDLDGQTVDGPATVLLPLDAPKTLQTPGGRKIVVCVAQTTDDMTCASCGLCAQADRKAVVGFRAHGQYAKNVPQLVQLRRAPGKPSLMAAPAA